jgi:hypothetical protein
MKGLLPTDDVLSLSTFQPKNSSQFSIIIIIISAAFRFSALFCRSEKVSLISINKILAVCRLLPSSRTQTFAAFPPEENSEKEKESIRQFLGCRVITTH